MGSRAGESVGELLVGNFDAEVFVLFVEKLLCEQTLDNGLCEHVAAIVAALVAELFACLRETLLVVLKFNCYAAGFSHGSRMAEVCAARCEEVSQDKSEECHYDDDEQ